jgi:hypothetical protein
MTQTSTEAPRSRLFSRSGLLELAGSRHTRWLLVPAALAGVWVYAATLNRSYPIADWLFWDLLPLWVACAAFSAACVSLGALGLRRLWGGTPEWPLLETLVQSFSIGLVGFTLAMYGGGALGMYGPVFAIVLMLLMLAAGARALLAVVRDARAREPAAEPRSRVLAYVLWGAGITCVSLAYLQVMTPDAINYDASWYHLPTAQDYAREGRIVPFYSDYNRAFPHLATFLYAWGAMLPGLSAPLRWMQALHLEFTCLLWTLAGVAAAARWLCDDSHKPATWVAFFAFPAIYVYDHNMGGSADHVLAVFAGPCFLAVARALPGLERRACILAGVALAGALLTKYQAAYWIGGLGVVLLGAWLRLLYKRFRAPSSEARSAATRPLWEGPAWLAGTLLALTSPHFIKNLIFYRNPVYPLAQGFFTGSYPQHPKSLFFMETIFAQPEHQLHGSFLEKLWQALKLGFTCSFEPHYSFTNAVPMLGSLFVLLLPVALFAPGKRRLWIGIIATYVATVTWAWTYVVDRYLQAVVPMMAAVTAALIVRGWQLGWPGRFAVGLLVLLQTVWGGDAFFYSGAPRLTSAMNLINTGFEKRAKARFDGYYGSAVAASKAMPANAQVLLHSERINLGLDRPITFDAPGMQGLVYYDDLAGPNALYETYRKLGLTHLAWLGNARSEHSKQGEILFATFVARYTKNRRTFGHIQLAEMPLEPPPPDTPLRALMLGTSYQDGLYDLAQLTIQERVRPDRQEPYPRPLERTKSNTETAELLARADALVKPPALQLPGGARRVLQKQFTKAMHYWTHEVFVRTRPQTTPGAADPNEANAAGVN